ncbi:unnamed protein product [Mytilus edulis]|uniref:C2H2-type domain-containing protein n=1 Tax=Mytilus edulis TaxID=6550 RepID=A0A8S3SS08_MYTED|nr:unnamed protein product [Mytilus edulis]
MDRKVTEKRIMCEHCFKLYCSSKSYKRHIKEVHSANNNTERIQCLICHKTFSRKSHLRIHTREFHKKTENSDTLKLTIQNESRFEHLSEEGSRFHDTPNFEGPTFGEMPDFLQDISLDEFITEPELDDSERVENGSDNKSGAVEPDENNNHSKNVIDSNKQTIILKLETTTVNLTDGRTVVNRDTSIEYFNNVNPHDINITIVMDAVTKDINEHLKQKQSAKSEEI